MKEFLKNAFMFAYSLMQAVNRLVSGDGCRLTAFIRFVRRHQPLKSPLLAGAETIAPDLRFLLAIMVPGGKGVLPHSSSEVASDWRVL